MGSEWLFAVAILALAALKIFRIVEQWFTNRERLVVNVEGGVTAYCSARVFRARRNMIVRGRVIVPETVAFSPRTPPVKGAWLSDKLNDLTSSLIGHDPALFIPFLSERDAPFGIQEQIFLGEPMEVRLKRMRRRIRVGQFLHLIAHSNQLVVVAFCLWILVGGLGLVVLPLKYFTGLEEQRQKSPATFITTDDKGVVEHRDAFSIISQLPIGDQPFGDLRDIHKGEVAEIFPVSAGLGAVCIRDADQIRICGVAPDSLGLQVGDAVYLRRGTLRHRAGIPTGAMEVLLIWAISETEAQALIERGHSFVK